MGNYYSREPVCVTNMLDQLGWEPLQHRRARNRVVMFYKIINHILLTYQHTISYMSKPPGHRAQLLTTSGISTLNLTYTSTRLYQPPYFLGTPFHQRFQQHPQWTNFNTTWLTSMCHLSSSIKLHQLCF